MLNAKALSAKVLVLSGQWAYQIDSNDTSQHKYLSFISFIQYFVILLLQLEKAYATASKNLLQLLIADNDLIGHLKSVKHYFLLDQGEFENSKLAFLFLKYPFGSFFIFAIS